MTVYLITDGRYTKIGVTGNITNRLKSLQTGSPLPLKVVTTIPGGEKLERALHKHYARKRVHGEWFDLTEADQKEIISAQSVLEEIPKPPEAEIEEALSIDLVLGLPEMYPEIALHFRHADPSRLLSRSGEVVGVSAGEHRTLTALSRCATLSDSYETLMLAVMLDLQYQDSRAGYLNEPLDWLAERFLTRSVTANPELWDGPPSLQGSHRCRQYVPLVHAHDVVSSTGAAWYSAQLCVLILRQSYGLLLNHLIGVPDQIFDPLEDPCTR